MKKPNYFLSGGQGIGSIAEGPTPQRMRRTTRMFLICAVFLTLCWLAFKTYALYRWDPKYDERQVIGLTENQVVERFGKPYFTKRSDGWRSEEQDGPLTYLYVGPFGKNYVLVVRDDRVVSVQRSMK